MSYPTEKLKSLSFIKTGKLDSNAANANGAYPFFTCDPNTLRINNWAYDTEAVLLAGNNANGNYTAKYYSGKFNAYQRVYIIETADAKRLNIRFLCYAINQQLHLLKKMSSGSTTKFLTLGMLHGLDIPLPAIEIQEGVVNILSSYDDFIENNQKQIKLLEEAAQRLYKEWFVDFRFPGHENVKIMDGVPEGWRTVKLSDVANVNKACISEHYPYDYVDYVDLGSVSRGYIEAITRISVQDAPSRAKRLAFDGDIIWGMVRPNLKSYALVLHPSETSVYSTGFAVLSAQKVPFSFLYCCVTQDDFVSYLVNCTNGAAYPAIKPDHFKEAAITLPTDSLLRQFNLIAEPMYRKIEILEKQIKQSKEARDRLLPKLMNREIEV